MKDNSALFLYDAGCRRELAGPLCGIDEVGRGPLAGPVVAAAVVLNPEFNSRWLNDSQMLSPKRRAQLYDEITACSAWAVGMASVEEIERINILNATFLAMNRAYASLGCGAALVLVDGNADPKLSAPVRLVVHGDATSASIAAASVVAKVTRDRMMEELDRQYPGYGFAKNVGYGTKEHIAAIRSKGVLPCHRASFLKRILSEIKP